MIPLCSHAGQPRAWQEGGGGGGGFWGGRRANWALKEGEVGAGGDRGVCAFPRGQQKQWQWPVIRDRDSSGFGLRLSGEGRAVCARRSVMNYGSRD